MKKSKGSMALVQVRPGVRAITFGGVTIFERDFESFTTTMEIAARFGKSHSVVLRAIRNLECSDQFSRCNFAPSTYTDDRGKSQPMFEVTRDGFMFLAMAFTGLEAAAWREKFIAAFKALERTVLQSARQERRRCEAEFQLARAQGKIARRVETDAIQEFVDYAVAQGCERKKAEWYYKNITAAVYKALGISEAQFGPLDGIRDRMDVPLLGVLLVADQVVAFALREGMAQALHFKEVFQLAKGRVQAYAASVPSAVALAPQMALAVSAG